MSQTDAALDRNAGDYSAPLQAMFEGLPHRYGMGWYQWAWDFYKSTNRMNLLVAANQISKSSTQIRKCIEWAGNVSLWPGLWKTTPKVFWYLYPDSDTGLAEYETKWSDFLPRGAYREHKTFGWRAIRGDKRTVDYLEFNSGVRVYFKSYSQKLRNLQAGSCHVIFADEELPEELYPELAARLFATDGYFHMVFTATLNQDFWRLAMEGHGEMETFPLAFKQQISMRDCITYRNGKPGPFTEERIRQIEASCKSETERQRRVDGRFITEGGRKYPQYDAVRHMKKPFTIPGDWRKYAGVDLGSGGKAHPPAIVFIAMRPDNRLGVAYKGWRGDDGQTYTAGDTLSKFLALRGNDLLVLQSYDQQAKDFGTIAARSGETFMPSDKSHERGEDVINTLFKNDMLFIFDTPELQKLGSELSTLMKMMPKRKARDDMADGLRYCAVSIPWDWSAIQGERTDDEKRDLALRPYTDTERVAMDLEERRGEFVDSVTGLRPGGESDGWRELEDEFDFWNEFAG